MKAVLRDLLTIEHDEIDAIQPSSPDFCIWLRALVGPQDLAGEESFDFAVCSPAWLDAQVANGQIVDGRFLLIAQTFDPSQIRNFVHTRLAAAVGDDWSAVATKIARWSYWEFEDYKVS